MLADSISEKIGDDWPVHLDQLTKVHFKSPIQVYILLDAALLPYLLISSEIVMEILAWSFYVISLQR